MTITGHYLTLISAALLGIHSSVSNAAIVEYSNRTAFEAATGTLNSSDFGPASVIGSRGCNGFDPNIDCGKGPLLVDLGAFTAEGKTQGVGGDAVELVFVAYLNNNDALYSGGTKPSGSPSSFQTTTTFLFPNPLNAFGAGLLGVNGPMDATLLDGITPVGTLDILVNADFFGVTSTTPFTAISFEQGVNDNVEYTDVLYQQSVIPVPAAVWLFASGLLGLISIARRR